jgi:hypothetical protein
VDCFAMNKSRVKEVVLEVWKKEAMSLIKWTRDEEMGKWTHSWPPRHHERYITPKLVLLRCLWYTSRTWIFRLLNLLLLAACFVLTLTFLSIALEAVCLWLGLEHGGWSGSETLIVSEFEGSLIYCRGRDCWSAHLSGVLSDKMWFGWNLDS